MRSKQELLVQALTGHLQAHHRFLLAEHLKHLSQLHDGIARLSGEIAERLQPYEKLLARLETIPGIKRRLDARDPGRDRNRYAALPQCATFGILGRDGALYHAFEYPRCNREEFERIFLGQWLT